MIKKLLKNFPLRYVVLTLISYIPFFLVDILTWLLGEEIPIDLIQMKVVYLSCIAGLLGFSRLVHHPGFGSKYSAWLALTPWKFGKPLPRGPVFMNFSDGVLLAVLTLLVSINNDHYIFGPLMAYLGMYTLMAMGFLLSAKKNIYILAFLFILPLAVYPHLNINISCCAVAVLYILAHMGTRSCLKEFPWNTDLWNYDQRKALLDTAIKGDILNGPYKLLRAVSFDSGIRKSEALTVCLLLTWWLHVANWFFVDLIFVIYFAFVTGATLIRLLIYLINCAPPITLWTRVFTRRFILPGYDKVMIAPLCIALVGALMPYLLRLSGLSMRFSLEISFFTVMMLAFTFPPSLKEWHLTGFHSVFLRPRNMQHARK